MNPFLCPDPNEKPLDHILPDGGYCAIFRTIACVGDSLASGEFEAVGADGKTTYHDLFEYSWGQYIARMCGSTVYNFSRGGMTAKEYCESYANLKGFWDPARAAQCYVIALGWNDIFNARWELGSLADVDVNDRHNNKPTYAGYYATIIQRYKEIQPNAKFFFITLPRREDVPETVKLAEKQTELLYQLAGAFTNCYVIDLFHYGPLFSKTFTDAFFLRGHMSPAGYLYAARLFASYIDFIIRHNHADFRQVGFIGREQYDPALDAE